MPGAGRGRSRLGGRRLGKSGAAELGDSEFTLIHTPGHALHHYCIVDPLSESVFTGDTFGISYRIFDTAKGPFIFPATTPVHFDPVQAHGRAGSARARPVGRSPAGG